VPAARRGFAGDRPRLCRRGPRPARAAGAAAAPLMRAPTPIALALVLSVGVVGSVSAAAGRRPATHTRAGQASTAARILYSSDWSGTGEIYAVDPSARSTPGQLTFGRAPGCGVAACAYAGEVPSPDGRLVL